jgi:hypothetical protein
MNYYIPILLSVFSIYCFGQNPIKFQGEDQKFGFKDQNGKVVVSIIYDEVEDFENNRAIVKSFGKKGVINLEGDILIPLEFDEVEAFKNNLAIVSSNNRFGVLDIDGNPILPVKYELINIRQNSILAFNDIADRDWLLFDLKGKKIDLPAYNYLDYFMETFLVVGENVQTDIFSKKVGGKWFLLDGNGKKVNDVPYDFIEGNFGELYKVCSGGKYNESEGFVEKTKGQCGFIDATGKISIPLVYDDAKNLSEGLVPVKLNGKWGFIDSNGKMIIPATFNYVEGFSDDLSVVYNGKKYGFIDKTGKLVIPYEYDSVDSFFLGEAYVTKENKTMKINTKGEIIE